MTRLAYNSPARQTPFLGREEDLAGVTSSLSHPDHRLITLSGPGGIGKTRLSYEVAHHLSSYFPDGTYFIALQPIVSTQFLASTIADCLSLPLVGQEDTRTQLMRHLADKQLLLVLDNFEHLLDGVDLVVDILESAPGVKLLITSREVLNLRHEWVWPVRAMRYPGAENDVVTLGEWTDVLAQEWSAVALFIECAHRVNPGFEAAPELAEICQICRLVEGNPLAIELAAAWLKVLNCKEIVAEIQQNLDFLQTDLHDVPSRHRSMQAVFEESWKLLSAKEREVLSCLSVFNGSFDREAAKQVAGATLPLLSALLDKSLIRRESSGRYQMHELLRQYAERHLARDEAQMNRARDRHRSYYAEFLGERARAATGERQREVMQEIVADLENIRVAWARAVAQVSIPDIQRAAYTYYQFTDFQSRFQEGTSAIGQAIEALEQAEPVEQRDSTLATLLSLQGYNYIRLGRYPQAKHAFEQSRAIRATLKSEPPHGFGTDPLAGLALLMDVMGNYEDALALAQESGELNIVRNDKLNLSIARYVQASAACALGRYDAAFTFISEANQLAEETSNRWMQGNIFVLWGKIAVGLGDYTQARDRYETSYKIKLEYNDPEGMALALLCLGRIALLQQSDEEAADLFRQSNDIYRRINDAGGLASSLCGQGDAALAQNNLASARDYLLEALGIALVIVWVPLVLSILRSIGGLLLKAGNIDVGVQLLALVAVHRASDLPTRSTAERLLLESASTIPPAVFKNAVERGRSTLIEDAARMSREACEFLTLRQGQTRRQTQLSSLVRSNVRRNLATVALVEPLSERELQVLRLLADGLTNEEIAASLDLVVGTVKTHNHNLFSKLGAKNRTTAIARAHELNLL